MNWFKANNCETVNVIVSQENSNTINFYRNVGFLPNTLHMKCKV